MKEKVERKGTKNSGVQVFVQTASGFAIGAASTGSEAIGDARARVRSRPGGTRASASFERATPVLARRLSPRSRRAWRKTRERVCGHVRNFFVPRDIGVFRAPGRSRPCTHRLVAHLQGLELIGGLDHLDHLERESVGVCVARGVEMKAERHRRFSFVSAVL